MSNRRLNRREFLRLGALGASAAVVAACAPQSAPTPMPAATAVPAPTKALAPTAAPAAAMGGTFRIYWNPGHFYETYKNVWAEVEKGMGVKIEVQQFQWPDMRTKLLADFAGGTAPDLVEGGPYSQEFSKNGYLEILDPYIAKDGKAMGFPDDWISNYPEQCEYDGKTYAIQLHLTCNTLVYNPAILEKAGVAKPPTTWQEFLDASKMIKEKTGLWGYAPEYQVGQAPTAFFWQNQVKFWDRQKRELTVNSPEGVESLQFQTDLVRTHKVAPAPQPTAGYEGPANLFIAEKVGMITTGPWNISPIRKGAPNLKWDIAAPLKGKIQATYRAGVNLSLVKDSKMKDVGWEIVKRITRADVEAKATKEAGMLMPRKSWAKSAEVAADPLITKWAEIMASTTLFPIFPYDIGFSEVYEKMFQEAYDNAIFGQMSPKEALDKYVREGNLKLKQLLG